MTSYVIKGARIVGGEPRDVLVKDGVVAEVGKVSRKSAEVVDADGLVLLPGLVDLHTHLREPGREDAETVESGSRAAPRGTPRSRGWRNVRSPTPPCGRAGVAARSRGGLVTSADRGVTVGLGGEQLAELGAMADSAPRSGYSHDGFCVSDPRLMRGRWST